MSRDLLDLIRQERTWQDRKHGTRSINNPRTPLWRMCAITAEEIGEWAWCRARYGKTLAEPEAVQVLTCLLAIGKRVMM